MLPGTERGRPGTFNCHLYQAASYHGAVEQQQYFCNMDISRQARSLDK